MSRFLDEAKRLIELNSVSDLGNEDLSKYIAILLEGSQFRVQTQQVSHSREDINKRQHNVIGIMGNSLVEQKIRKGLLLLTPMDTVKPGHKKYWSRTTDENPFKAHVSDDKIYGLGVADSKLDFLCKLHAARKFRDKKLKTPLYLVATCGDKVGMIGTRFLLESQALNPLYTLVGKPTHSKLVYQHSASQLYLLSAKFQIVEKATRGFNRRANIRSRGLSAAAYHTNEGVNSIVEIMKFLSDANKSGFELRFSKLSGGSPVLQVPDDAQAEFYLTPHQLEDFKRFFTEKLKEKDRDDQFELEIGSLGNTGMSFFPTEAFECLNRFFEWTHEHPELRVNFYQLSQDRGELNLYFQIFEESEDKLKEFHQKFSSFCDKLSEEIVSVNLNHSKQYHFPALNLSEDNEFLKICANSMEKADLFPNTDKGDFSSEAGLFFQKDFDVIVFGPGDTVKNINRPNESNQVEQLQGAIRFYEKIIESVCL